MNPQQLRHAYQQCVEETDRLAQQAHRTEHLFRQQARHRQLARQLEAFLTARDAYTAARHLHSQALAVEGLALGRWLSALVAAAAPPGQ